MGDGLTSTQVFYLLLLFGSVAFGFEALLLCLGGRLSVLYRRNQTRLIGLALPIGLAIVGVPLMVTVIFDLEPLHLCTLIFIHTLVVGKIASVFGKRFVKPTPIPPPDQLSDEELRTMLEKRGFGKLMMRGEKRERRDRV